MTPSATTRPIRVLVVDDSAFMRTALSRMIASESGLEVAATACSGADALEKIAALKPDVHVKSAQYRIDELPEKWVVESNGGVIVLAPHVPGKSTTDLVAAIRARG